MAKPDFANRLVEDAIPLEHILLDPNNPRLIGLDGYNGVPERRITESEVQAKTLDRLNSGRGFDQDALRASIEQSGLLPVDRIVVRALAPEAPPANGEAVPTKADLYYVVVEGNRRIAACMTLRAQHASGEKTLDDMVLAGISTPRVLVLQGVTADEARLDQWVIQGVRHISGIRPWGAYQAAKTIEAMIDKLGYSEAEVASALSISVGRVRRSVKVLAALAQMAESEDYEVYAGPALYNDFDEVLKKPAVRTWLGWRDETSKFENEDRAEQFYSWITPDDDLHGERRIPIAENIRELDAVLGDPAALDVLNTAGKQITEALRVASPNTPPDWREPLERAAKALNSMPIGELENLRPEDRDLIGQLVTLAQTRLRQADEFGQ